MTQYTQEPVPGTFDHRSMDDCLVHGANAPHFRLRGELGPFHCVACALTVLKDELELSTGEE